MANSVKVWHHGVVEFRRDSLERFHTDGKALKYVPPELRKILRRKLIMSDRSVSLTNLRIPPANRLERKTRISFPFHSLGRSCARSFWHRSDLVNTA